MADLQEELKRRESRWSAASTRSRQKIEVLEEQNKELQEEVKLLEHYRLQQWREEEQAKVRYTPVKQCGDTSAVCDFTRVLVSLTELNNVCACAGLWRGKRTSRWCFPCRFSFTENFQKIFTSPKYFQKLNFLLYTLEIGKGLQRQQDASVLNASPFFSSNFADFSTSYTWARVIDRLLVT